MAPREFAPTMSATQRLGINASWPGRPSKKPEIRTPAKRRGRICLAKNQVESIHSLRSSLLNHLQTILAVMARNPPPIIHFALAIICQSPNSPSALPQLMKTRNPIMEAKYRAVFQSGLSIRVSSAREKSLSSCLFFSSFRKIRCMSRPMTTAKTIAPTALASPSLYPRTLAVRMIARTLMAGPE